MQQPHEAGGPVPYQQHHGGSQPNYVTPDHEGLQVNQIEHQRGLYPQVQQDAYPEVMTAGDKDGLHYPPPLEIAPESRGKSRRVLWIIAGVAAIVVVAVVIGCVVGLVVVPRSRGVDSPASASPTPGLGPNVSDPATARSACRGLVCPQILAADSIGSDIFVFGRGVDNAIWYASNPAASTSSWARGSWRRLGGPFLSQPSALTWLRGARLSVFAVADPDRSVRARTFSGSAWGGSEREWDNLLGQVASPVAVCLVDGYRADLWAAFPGTVTVGHNFYLNETDRFWAPGESTTWQASADFDQMRSTPAIVCRNSTFTHDLVVYGRDLPTVRHSTWSPGTSWTISNDRGGRFVGSPVAIATNDSRFDFFGIADDGTMRHFAWSSTGGYSPIENLGSSFQSAPSAIATDAGGGQQRIDVVALGTNDLLRHRVLVGSSWASEWEDLPVFGNSAPLVVHLKTQPPRLGLFVLGLNGEVNQTAWEVSSELSWRSLLWSGIGGNLTSDYFGI